MSELLIEQRINGVEIDGDPLVVIDDRVLWDEAEYPFVISRTVIYDGALIEANKCEIRTTTYGIEHQWLFASADFLFYLNMFALRNLLKILGKLSGAEDV